MSKIKLTGHGSGSGTLTIQAPDTDSARTITLPDATGTLLNSDGSAASLTAIPVTGLRPSAKPLIINGDMSVAQRSTSVAGITTGSPGPYNTSDRWSTRNDTAGTWTQTQEALTSGNAYEDGFSTALKLDCTTADASLGANDMLRVMYAFEGTDLQVLKYGSSTAEALTVSFWVKATKTGTNALSVYEETTNRSCNKTYTINTTNTWEKKVISFPGDTSGGIDNDSTASLWLNFFIAAGTNYTSGTLNETWAASSNANRAVGQVNNADSTSNNFHITGVQLEVGEYTAATIPPFQFENYGDNLSRCERYYHRHKANIAGAGICAGGIYSTTAAAAAYRYPTIMRTNPTLSYSGVGDFRVLHTTTHVVTAIDGIETISGVRLWFTSSGMTAGNGMMIDANNTSCWLAFDAEL